IDTESNETTTLLNAFDWAQDNGYTGPNWNKFSYSLAAFTGKKVKFEFNYPFGGENLAIDGFRLTKEDASAAETIHIFEGESIQFVSLAKGSPDATEWKFPGSASETSTDPNPTVTYNKAGTYDVSLTVRRGNESDVMERKGFVVVAQKAPTALIGLPEEGYESPWVGVFVPTDVPVTFRDLSTGNPTEWNWVFQYADKETSNEQNPTVTFVKKGTVSVGLTAKNAAGQSNDVLQYAIQAGGSQYVWNISSEENSNLKKVELGWFGSYAGSNWLGLDRFAEKYKAPLADATINEVAVYFASVTSINPDYEVRLTLNAVGENGEPGEELASTSVKASDLKYSDDDYLATTFTFAEPVSMEKGKEFFVVVGPFPNGTMEESPYTSDDISIFCLRRNAGRKTTSWQLVEDTDENDNGLGTYTWFANTDDPTSMAIAPCVTYKDTGTSIGVTTPATDAEATVTAVYSISGQRVNAPVRGGMYIMRYSDGTCRKVMWK
uniref:PKD domain-containing protein n=1 Tax=Prevotella sp. TaxID=59823 RepID=UPI004028CE3E